jgi:hypothetical protein
VRSRSIGRTRRLAVAAFAAFLVKGVLWLLVPAILYWIR